MFAETFSQQTSNLKQGLKTFHENEDGDIVVILILIAISALAIAVLYQYMNGEIIPKIKEALKAMGLCKSCS